MYYLVGYLLHISLLLSVDCCTYNRQYKKAGTAEKPGQELTQKRSATCPPFIHYLAASAPIKTDEVTLHSVLLLDL